MERQNRSGKRILVQIGKNFYILPTRPLITIKDCSELKTILDSASYDVRLLSEEQLEVSNG